MQFCAFSFLICVTGGTPTARTECENLMDNSKRVGVILHSGTGYSTGAIRGVAEYIRQHERWQMRWQSTQPKAMPDLLAWRPHGVICYSQDRLLEYLDQLDCPAVTLSGGAAPEGMPRVNLDNHAVGQLAAEYLYERGYRSFAFVDERKQRFSEQRQQGFENYLAQRDCPCRVLRGAPRQVGGVMLRERSSDSRLRDFLRELELPAAVFASRDAMAIAAVQAAREAGLRVPDDVAVLGVDNDRALCELAPVPVSSIELPFLRIGYLAAEMLSKLMARETLERSEVLLPPLGVVTRQSTDMLAVSDRHVRDALHFIRGNSDRPISVADVVGQTGISRRPLEQRFRRDLSRSIHAEIQRVHLNRACELLSQTDLPVEQVAEMSGFTGPVHFSRAFRRELDTTPTDYRIEHRGQAVVPAKSD